MKLVDAGFVWTEPHSRRLKVKLTIQKEVLNGAILQQAFVIEYVVNNLFCEDVGIIGCCFSCFVDFVVDFFSIFCLKI